MITGSQFLMYAIGLILGIIAGFVMHRSDYCVAGMFRDIFLFKSTFMLRALIVQVALTMALFEVSRLLGLLPVYPFPLLGFASLSNIIGGFIFGTGMVMAGGCVVGTLYKMGAGSVISLVAFVGLIFGSGLYAEFHPWWAAISKATTILPTSKTVPQVLGFQPTLVIVPILVVTLCFIIKWHKDKKLVRASEVKGYIQPLATAIILALIGLCSYVLIGMPLGITTTYAKMAAMIENVFAPGHVSQVLFFQSNPLNSIHPTTGALLLGGAGPQIDSIWAIQFPIIAGIVLGSALSAIILREFSFHYRVPMIQFAMALCGGILLGIASRMTPGCNVWHLMGGFPVLALQSIFFLFGLFPGAWLGSMIVKNIILNNPQNNTSKAQ